MSPHDIRSYQTLEPPLLWKDQPLLANKLSNCHGMLRVGMLKPAFYLEGSKSQSERENMNLEHFQMCPQV